jgi:hypothetical protein
MCILKTKFISLNLLLVKFQMVTKKGLKYSKEFLVLRYSYFYSNKVLNHNIKS